MKKWIFVGVAAAGLLVLWQIASGEGAMAPPLNLGLRETEPLDSAIPEDLLVGEAPDAVAELVPAPATT